MGNLAPDVSADVVEDVMAKFKSMDRVIMKQGTLLTHLISIGDDANMYVNCESRLFRAMRAKMCSRSGMRSLVT